MSNIGFPAKLFLFRISQNTKWNEFCYLVNQTCDFALQWNKQFRMFHFLYETIQPIFHVLSLVPCHCVPGWCVPRWCVPCARRPLNNESLVRCVPCTMPPLYNASLVQSAPCTMGPVYNVSLVRFDPSMMCLLCNVFLVRCHPCTICILYTASLV
jgi:hypothetical protein